jgi:regulator of sirC expression with transglutaminase-like and TPR domain
VFNFLRIFPLLAATSYFSLDPLSISQQIAFYQLYPDTQEGKIALQKACDLLCKTSPDASSLFPTTSLETFISLMTDQPITTHLLTETELLFIESAAKNLKNRSLSGYGKQKREELFSLSSDQVDLARALLLCQEADEKAIRQYEAHLDLMALQILARFSPTSSAHEKIHEINRYIFEEMRFRFPPHSLWAKDIDVYTFLPSVLDRRQGVCLGVSILYLSLAQRLGIPLEIITPPGHIYLRYLGKKGDCELNIETTARGIDLPTEHYLSISTYRLPERTMKEVIALAYINQAAVSWEKTDYLKAVDSYEKATAFLPDDPLLKMFLGINYLFIGKVEEGKKLLREIRNKPFPWSLYPETIPEDFLEGRTDIEALKIVFLPVDETRESILNKQSQLQKVLEKHPRFRAALFHLSITYLQLGRGKEAEEVLTRYSTLDSSDPTANYYLTVLALQRRNFPKAWDFFKKVEKQATHLPKALRELKLQLQQVSPQPIYTQMNSKIGF